MLRALLLSLLFFTLPSAPCAGQADKPAESSAIVPQPSPVSNPAASVSSEEDLAAENNLLQAANRSRNDTGAAALRMDETLRQAARVHARRMVAGGRLEHQFSGELGLLERIGQAGALKTDRAGENLAVATCAADAHSVLMRSPPHRHNLLDTGFDVVGIAAFRVKGRLYVVQDFAHEVPSYSTQQTQKLVAHAIASARQDAALPQLTQAMAADLDAETCRLSEEGRPNARLLAASYENRRIVTYTQNQPGVLPSGALRAINDPALREFAVGSCYARNDVYPTGTYWVAILLY